MKLSSSALTTELRWAAFVAPKGSRWQHKYGGSYEVVGHGFGTKSGEVEVVYVRFDGPDYNPELDPYISFHRPVSEWTTERFSQITE